MEPAHWVDTDEDPSSRRRWRDAGVSLHDLLDSEGVESVGLADLRLERVREVAARLSDDRVELVEVDARDASGLSRRMSGWDAVINSTWYELNLDVMRAPIRGSPLTRPRGASTT
ncbi:MAG: hypothetical protein E6K96_03850 [Thaumarchaeota archaeon]|nr:MAG: hypothetical protein E6K96_03850 [Nitrososphaerota archaeon]